MPKLLISQPLRKPMTSAKESSIDGEQPCGPDVVRIRSACGAPMVRIRSTLGLMQASLVRMQSGYGPSRPLLVRFWSAFGPDMGRSLGSQRAISMNRRTKSSV